MTITADGLAVWAVEPDMGKKIEAESGSDLARLLDGDVVARLTKEAQAAGIPLSGEGGLLKQLTKMVLETALQGEMDAHLGYGKHEPAGRNKGNSRNGSRSKTVVTDVGPVEIEVPRDRDASFEPQMVAKRQRRLSGVDNMVISLTARGLTSGEISAHLAEVYGTKVSKETISVITDRMLDTMADWQARPLDSVYPVLFVDCIYMKIRDGAVANRPVYVALGVTVDGGSDVLGLWIGDSAGEGAKFWMRVLTELKNRGVADVCMLVCDGLKGLPEVVGQVWPETVVQQCIIHLLRNTFRYASKRDWAEIARDIKPVYTAPSEQAALDAFAEFSDKFPGYQMSVEGELLTLSRLPIVAAHHHPVPGTGMDWFRKGTKAQRTDIRVGGRTVSFYNVHLPVPFRISGNPLSGSFYRALKEQGVWRLRELCKLRADLAGNPHPAVLAGDFNSPWMELSSLGADTRVHGPTGSLAPPRTWPVSDYSLPRLWRLDWLFTTGDLTVPDHRLGSGGEAFSDHAAQVFRVAVPDDQKGRVT